MQTRQQEMQFLLDCISFPPDAVTTCPPASLDWSLLSRLAMHHEVCAQLYNYLTKSPHLDIPSDFLSNLKSRVQFQTRHMLLMSASLQQIQSAFQLNGVQAICWKGPALALLLYGHVGSRPCCDLDLVIAPNQLAPADITLQQLGYMRVGKGNSKESDEYFEHLHQEISYIHPQTNVPIELHTKLMPMLHASWTRTEEYSARAIAYPLNQQIQANTFAITDLLMSLCAHGAKHHWEKLKWSYDIAILISKFADQIAMQGLLEQATKDGNERILLTGVLLASQLYHVQLPSSLHAAIEQDKKNHELAGRLHHNLLTGYSSIQIAPEAIALDTTLQKGLLRNIRYLLRRLFQLSMHDISQTSGQKLPRIASYRSKFLRLAGKYWRYLLRDAKSAV